MIGLMLDEGPMMQLDPVSVIASVVVRLYVLKSLVLLVYLTAVT